MKLSLDFLVVVITVLILVKHKVSGDSMCKAFNKCDPGYTCVGGYCRKPFGLSCFENSDCSEYGGGKCDRPDKDNYGYCRYSCSANGNKCDKYKAGCCNKNCKNGLCGGCVAVGSTCKNDKQCCGTDRTDERQVLCFKDHCTTLKSICKLSVGKDCKNPSDCYLSGNSRTECYRQLICVDATGKCSDALAG